METTDTRAWLDARMTELRRKYADGTPLPSPAGSTHHPHCQTMIELTRDCTCAEQMLSISQLRRLMRAVQLEHEDTPRGEAHGRA